MGISSPSTSLWIFGYGSLCWNPGFEHRRSAIGYIQGFSRRFWQGNITHRGIPGRVENAQDELASTSKNAVRLKALEAENGSLSKELSRVRSEFNSVASERSLLAKELSDLQFLFDEYKSAGGSPEEEAGVLSKIKEEALAAKKSALRLESELQIAQAQSDDLKGVKIRLLREIAQLKREYPSANLGADVAEGNQPLEEEAAAAATRNGRLTPSEAALMTIGHLRIYEVILGVFFVIIVLNYVIAN
uniref:Cation transport regulator-like protein 1 n=1 Tax=Caligus rogercresseyi TaxID=217165 RepID=C1BRI2_CALRO|nr:Cation transport regulator-like protein 1 [Caligus rogercresseyi]